MPKTIIITCLITLTMACHKSEMKEPETSDQVLTKIAKTSFIGGISYSETIGFEYDNAKRIIAEGDNHYERDDKGRIIKIVMPPNNSNRRDIYVYYADATSGMVAYTRCDFKVAGGWMAPDATYNFYDSIGGHDSSVYIHENGKVTTIQEYFSSNGITFNRSFAYTMKYDDKGNLKEMRRTGAAGNLCNLYYYYEYDYLENPLHSNDEVRIREQYWSTGNISANNLLRGNHISGKHFEYRTDGRPRTCNVYENGQEAYRLTYYYK